MVLNAPRQLSTLISAWTLAHDIVTHFLIELHWIQARRMWQTQQPKMTIVSFLPSDLILFQDKKPMHCNVHKEFPVTTIVFFLMVWLGSMDTTELVVSPNDLQFWDMIVWTKQTCCVFLPLPNHIIVVVVFVLVAIWHLSQKVNFKHLRKPNTFLKLRKRPKVSCRHVHQVHCACDPHTKQEKCSVASRPASRLSICACSF